MAIMAADVAEYARLTEIAEEDTHIRLRTLRVGTIDPCVVSYRGQIIKNTGDGFLATFDSTMDALRCAIELQHDVATKESPEPSDRQIRLRMALNVGEVISDLGDVYGGSVNIATRLEQFAPPGGVVVSDALLAIVKPRMNIAVDDLGPLELKNISQPIRAYSLRMPSVQADSALLKSPSTRRAALPSIAILPFRTTGENPDDAYFGEGMVDDIIFALSSIRGLMVISRTSALAYRTGPIDLQKVGQDLGVRYAVSGSVRRVENRLRITVELADVESGSVIWADRHDGTLSELFDLQERIATRIVWSLAPHVRESELKRALRKRPENMNAYDLLLQAIDLLYRMNPTDFARAGDLLRQSIAADDNYATAYAYAALWQVHHINQGWSISLEADSADALRLAAAAVERDPADGFALATHGHTKAVLFRDYDGAIELFDRALEAAPGNAMAWALSSGVYSYTGRAESAIERAERGMRLSPVDTQAYFYLLFLTLAHYMHGTFDEAVIWGRKSMALNRRACSNLRWLIASHVALGQHEEAKYCAQAMLDISPNFRLSQYAKWSPLRPDLRETLLTRLRAAGLPE